MTGVAHDFNQDHLREHLLRLQMEVSLTDVGIVAEISEREHLMAKIKCNNQELRILNRSTEQKEGFYGAISELNHEMV